MRSKGKVTIILGGQFGSEGKGAFCHWYARNSDASMTVRVGGPNAGHCVIVQGDVLKMQTIPCTFAVDRMQLVIGQGAVIDPVTLAREIELVKPYIGHPSLYVDGRATIISEADVQAEAGLVKAIASTGHGIGGARAARIMRTALTVDDYYQQKCPGFEIADTTVVLKDALARDEEVIIETTQGWGLSLFSSGYYPFVTSMDCTPAQALADTGLPISGFDTQVVLVMRSFPIRVGGPSGPMYRETDWKTLIQQTDGYITEPERTTVTNRIRRIGEWNPELAKRACEACRPDAIALTFVDYIDPEANGAHYFGDLSARAQAFVNRVEEDCGVPVRWVSVGFEEIFAIPPYGYRTVWYENTQPHAV